MIRIAIIGLGKIARDSHLPAIAADPRFTLAAVATRSGDPALGVPWFAEPGPMFDAMADAIDAVAICTPPAARHLAARRALDAGIAVLLEKPPAATLGEIDDLAHHARARGGCLYAGWHSQHAPGVGPAAALLRDAAIRRLQIAWREDVRKWHPGQEWIWDAGGFGVFDPGINALSIATAILPEPLFVRDTHLEVPANRQAPIAARLEFGGGDMGAVFDWRPREGEEWTIAIETAEGRRIDLHDGGARLVVDGTEQPLPPSAEYPSIYDRFAGLVAARRVEVDREPLRIVADAFLQARRTAVEPFMWTGQD